jgi:hypothetical protein
MFEVLLRPDRIYSIRGIPIIPKLLLTCVVAHGRVSGHSRLQLESSFLMLDVMDMWHEDFCFPRERPADRNGAVHPYVAVSGTYTISTRDHRVAGHTELVPNQFYQRLQSSQASGGDTQTFLNGGPDGDICSIVQEVIACDIFHVWDTDNDSCTSSVLGKKNNGVSRLGGTPQRISDGSCISAERTLTRNPCPLGRSGQPLS